MDTPWWAVMPETLMIELGADTDDTLLYEKLMALKVIKTVGINEASSLPEFFLHFTETANNNLLETDLVPMPNSLEMAWAVYQLQLIGTLLGTQFEASESLGQTIGYLLREEGYSKRLDPFTFVPEGVLAEGQSDQDTALKAKAITEYILFMRKTCSA